MVFRVWHAKTLVLITYKASSLWCVPIRKWLVKRRRFIEHGILLSMGIKAKVEKGGESRMRYNCCCLKYNTKPCGHLVWYFVFVMQKCLVLITYKVISLWCVPIGKWLVKRRRFIEHGTLLSMGIKAKVEKGGESRMRYNCCCLKENTKPCGHLVWYFVFVMQ